jgi:hypothetical protein
MGKVHPDMNDTQSRGLKIAYILLGVAMPLLALTVLAKSSRRIDPIRKEEIDQAHDVTVEDSFPASDPPSAW